MDKQAGPEVSKRELAFKAFLAFSEEYQSKTSVIHNPNEATTRLLIIDEILKILGWDKSEFHPETHCASAGFADYILTTDNTPRLVVEAKKVGMTFCTPARKLIQQEYTVSYFKNAFKKNLTEVIEQAEKYCLQESVPYALITNGAEWMVFQTLPKPGKTIDSMKGVYFGNIFSEQFAFDFFWTLLAKESVTNSSLENHVSEINYRPSEICHVIKSDYGVLQWQGSSKDNFIAEFYESFFSQITEVNQRTMLEHCFVADSKLNQFKGDLKRVLKDNQPRFLPQDTEDLEPGDSKDSILSDRNSGKVIIITGSIGCGKTTLVTKCLIESRQQGKQNATPLLIDLINDVSKNNINVTNIIYDYLYAKLEESYADDFNFDNLRKTFCREIQLMKRGAYSTLFKRDEKIFEEHEAKLLTELTNDKEKFLFSTLKRKIKDNNSVILIFDNVDRASEAFQEEVYALAHKLASTTGATVIITLREFTFFKNRAKGFMDVRPEDKIIHLKAPDFNQLISTRIKYVQKHLDEDFRTKEWRKKYDFKLFKDAMLRHASALKNSTQSSNNGRDILAILSAISWHNVRQFYELLKRIHLQLDSTNNDWSKEDVIAALMSSVSNEEIPYLPNIFKPYQNHNQCYFLKLRMLIFLNHSIKEAEVVHGIPIQRIQSFALLYGYKPDWIIKSIEECVKEQLIECLEVPSDGDISKDLMINSQNSFRISPLGVTYISDICTNPVYMALIAIDLPFHENDPYTRTKKEFDEVSTFMNETANASILREGIEVVLESELKRLSTEYLMQEYQKEKVPPNFLISNTEVHIAENQLNLVMNQFSHLAGITFKPGQNQKCAEKGGQMELGLSHYLSDEEASYAKLALTDFVPDNIESMSHNGSEFIPLIFCALVIQKRNGIEHCFGVDLTNVINDELVSDSNRKFPNNVSRSLRSKVLQEQQWLLTRHDLHKKRPKFSLRENWQVCWEEVFGFPISRKFS